MTKHVLIAIICCVLFSLAGCSSQKVQHHEAITTSTANDLCSAQSKNERLKMAVLWYENAGEMKALYYQGYRLGKQVVDRSLQQHIAKKRAIVLDIDETVLNNGPYLESLVKSGTDDFDHDFGEWVEKAEAKPLPGVRDFLNYVNRKGIDIYYISNRNERHLEATMKNLKMAGLPQVTSSHVLLKTNEASKESRRQLVEKNHEIIALFGDNLIDFAHEFDGKSTAERNNEVEQMQQLFGDKFIVFPNSIYGSWDDDLDCRIKGA
ncbi:5'-nucleotidase, lipoprotein e(P4) family [Bacillus ginsengihumi]|uniref:5'-nucleotidase n=1 Tax=Heyndrickxia ginsengihumi TaxID=363870 RepID=A0A0A6VDJ6_9BACI|nr:5'-nucleotidase, lipoprotein e(P4) family [Heyndrickxia ginsengihumi]KHD84614.1 5'-nucleotidase [Heyndrickxia ginsengihumi]NEY19127.1 5'-nucleotidase, lipoprotein e(P4) family [Heyndrickxia ginsengihumi]